MKGKILHTSWGYDMTINDYCIVVDETPKSVLCKMLDTKVKNDDGHGMGKATPTLNESKTKTFRLFKRGENFKGSYPFCGDSKRMGYFWVWNGRDNYQNTWD